MILQKLQAKSSYCLDAILYDAYMKGKTILFENLMTKIPCLFF